MQTTMIDVENEMKKYYNLKRANSLFNYLKINDNVYAKNDIFIGVPCPNLRRLARQFQNISYDELKKFIKSNIHEYRLFAIYVLQLKYAKGEQKSINLLLKNINKINNWDLVDIAANLIGKFIYENKNKIKILNIYSESKNYWKRRLSLVSTLHFIKNNSFVNTKRLATKLCSDEHVMVQKAIGWMLKEMGKINKKELLNYLDRHHKKMKRIALGFATEKLKLNEKKKYFASI